jgi:hypothetical protein
MKKYYLLFLLFVSVLKTYSQSSNLVLFSEDGYRFYAIMNGVRQNEKAQTNVKITGITFPNFVLKIIFENERLGSLDKTIYLSNINVEDTYNIKFKSDGKGVIRFLSTSPLAINYTPQPNEQVVVYHTQPYTVGTTTQTTTTTTTTNNLNNNLNMNVGINGIGMNINVSDPMFDNDMSQTTTTHTTTTTTTTNGSNMSQTQNVYVMPGYSGPTGCGWPVTEQEFGNIRNSITSKTFEDSKLTIAKQVVQNRCLFASEVREIMMMFTFENSKLDFAKFAYRYTYDIGNYYKVNDAFEFESSIDDLNRSIGGGR